MALAEVSITPDAPPGRLQYAAACAIVVVAFAAALCAIPYGATPVVNHQGAVAAFGSITAFADLFTAILLVGQARAAESRAAMHLAAAYLFSFLLVIPDLLSFPGAFAGGFILGAAGTAAWLWYLWHIGFPLFIASFALHARWDRPPRHHGAAILVVAIAAAAGAIVLTTLGLPHLAVLVSPGDPGRTSGNSLGVAAVVCNLAALALVLARSPTRSTVTLWVSVAMAATCLDVTLSLAGGVRYTVGWYVGRSFGLLGHLTLFIALLFESMRLYSRVSAANRHLERLSRTDQLTELPNRRAFEAHFDLEWRRAEREHLPVSLLMIDVDRFKAFNDRYGHPAGDRCLQVVARALAGLARRPLDLVARIGGEEFVVLLPNTEPAGAILMGERVRAAITALGIPNAGVPMGLVTVSVGVATEYPRPHGASGASLLERSDAALYQAKRDGRNTVRAAELDYADGTIPWSAPRVASPTAPEAAWLPK